MTNDVISRQAAIDALGDEPLVWTEGEYALGLRNQWQSDVDALRTLPSAQPEKRTEERTETHASDLISRHEALDALWKALHDYEDKAEKQFLESDALDVGDWIEHRIFVQNMNDIDRKVILDLPSAQPELIRCRDCEYHSGSYCHYKYSYGAYVRDNHYCGWAERRTDEGSDFKTSGD